MATEKKKLYLISVGILASLVPILFVPSAYCRWIAALVLAAIGCALLALMKKRAIPSINHRQVTGILAVISVIYLVLIYLLGMELGFVRNSAALTFRNIWQIVLPMAVIIVFAEIVRYVLLSQAKTVATVSAYAVGILSELLLCGGLFDLDKLSRFLDVVGLTLFPAIASNFLYHYLCKRYGAAPSAVFRLMLALPLQLLPIAPNITDAIQSFLLMLLPLFAWTFVDLLYEKKAKYALSARKSKWSFVSLGGTLVMMAMVIMLISGNFRYKLIVIATPSMTGAINEGDAIIYEEYDGHQTVEEGDVLVFTKNDKDLIVHRVIDAQYLNGTVYYTTKGDANDSTDSGYITAENIRGVVLFKIPHIGNPSLWLRDAFS